MVRKRLKPRIGASFGQGLESLKKETIGFCVIVPRTEKGAPGLESKDVSGYNSIKGIRQNSPVS